MSLINFVNNRILKDARKIDYIVKDTAPSTEKELFNQPGLVIWSGASDNSIYGDPKVNWAFRALHDDLHHKTRLGFSPEEEIEMGRIQASKYDGILADIIYCEVALQAKYFLKNGVFVPNQVGFLKENLGKIYAYNY